MTTIQEKGQEIMSGKTARVSTVSVDGVPDALRNEPAELPLSSVPGDLSLFLCSFL